MIFFSFLLLIPFLYGKVIELSANNKNLNAFSSLWKIYLTYEIDTSHFQYTLYHHDKKWFQSSNDIFFRSNGKKYSLSDGNLFIQKIQMDMEGEDSLGVYHEIQIHFVNEIQDIMIGRIKQYARAVVFEQEFPNSLMDTSSSNADDVISSFPSFEVHADDEPAGFAHWDSWYYTDTDTEMRRKLLVAPGFTSPRFGLWNESVNLWGGIGGSGVNCLFTHDGKESVVISPYYNFMAMSHTSPKPGVLNYGIMGNVTSLPANFVVKTILYAGQGINPVMKDWGTAMRKVYGKSDAAASREKDVTLKYLGFNTDNGAYYYYNTVPGYDYQQTLIEVKKYADQVGIPYHYVLLDSWWYYKGTNGGVTEWTGRPDIFPDGVEAVYEGTGWLVQGHNRYWSNETPYAIQNGGSYEFQFDNATGGAVPLSQQFWDDLFSVPKASWGLQVYEQDWLNQEFDVYASSLLESATLGRNWLLQMGAGADKNGLTIQYCMPYTRHLLTSLEVQAVTQARASDDYKPGEDVDQWRIAGQSILIDALGLAPSKDGLWTTTLQAGNPYGEDHNETNPRLQSAVVTLSAGPVAPGDGINYSDVELIMKSCMKNGRLLQPSVPAMPLDISMFEKTFGSGHGPQGEVWYASTTLGSRQFGYLFVADLKEDFVLTPAMMTEMGLRGEKEYWIFESQSPTHVFKFSNTQPLTMKACGLSDFKLYTILPIESNGFSLQGEVDKWVSVSAARFGEMSSSSAGITTVIVSGSPDEIVSVNFLDGVGKVVSTVCNFESGSASSSSLLTKIASSTGQCA